MNEQFKAVFGIDPEGPHETFIGWHDPWNTWNGWATPGFDRTEVERVMAWITAAGTDPAPTFTWDGDVLVMTEVYDGEPQVTRMAPDAFGRYGLGAFAWCWSVQEESDEEIDKAASDAKEEITADIDAGIVPGTVTRFEELHNYVDANDYAGFTDRRGHWSTADLIRYQSVINQWLEAGRP